MTRHFSEYQPLFNIPSEKEEEGFSSLQIDAPAGRSRRSISRQCPSSYRTILFGCLALLQLIVDVGFVYLLWRSPLITTSHGRDIALPYYSPAQDVIEYEYKVFSKSQDNDTTPYDGPPSDEIDALWEDLYQFGISEIPKHQATLLLNQTARIPETDDQYIVELHVFHDLHCLNYLRQGLDPDYYLPQLVTKGINSKEELIEHNRHCIGALRQSIMCHGDVSPLVWQWRESMAKTMPTFTTLHVCRNFDAIREWGIARTVPFFNDSVHLEDDIVVPIIH